MKFIEAGITKEIQTLMDIPLKIVGIVWALVISNFFKANNSLIVSLWMIPVSIGINLVVLAFVYFLDMFKDAGNNFDWSFYLIYFAIGSLNYIVNTTAALAILSFIAKVSDENVGGTYMTLLNTFLFLGILKLEMLNSLVWR